MSVERSNEDPASGDCGRQEFEGFSPEALTELCERFSKQIAAVRASAPNVQEALEALDALYAAVEGSRNDEGVLQDFSPLRAELARVITVLEDLLVAGSEALAIRLATSLRSHLLKEEMNVDLISAVASEIFGADHAVVRILKGEEVYQVAPELDRSQQAAAAK